MFTFSSCIDKCNDKDFTFRIRFEHNLADKISIELKADETIINPSSKNGDFIEYCFAEMPGELKMSFDNIDFQKFEVKSMLIENQNEQVFLNSNYLFRQYFISNQNATYIKDKDVFELTPNAKIQFASRVHFNKKMKQMKLK